ncbi:MAG: Intermembrane phospholipid transport system binding protein MlaC [Legionellaceae bacterium]
MKKNSLKNKFTCSFSILLLLFSLSAHSIDSPLPMLQTVSEQMLQKLKSNKQSTPLPTFIEKIVRENLVPHFDLNYMSRMVIGRDTWKIASPTQQNEFIEKFTVLLIRTYSTALSSYTDQTITFYPIRGQLTEETQVESKIFRQDGPPIPVSYRLKLEDKNWKIYDFSVDGVSLIESFRNQFSHEIAEGGIKQLLEKLAQHNQQKN